MPPDRVAGLTDAVRHLRESTGEPSRPSLDRLADELRLGGRASRSIVLSAPRTELRELILVAMDEAGETLAAACAELLRGHASLGVVSSKLAELGGLVELLDDVEAAG